MDTESKTNQVAYFAGGCFWGVEAAFRKMDGVLDTAVGYMGGPSPSRTQNGQALVTYEEVCSGTTGHAEVVQVTYDPEKVSYGDLLKEFWLNHDPTELNKQGPDVGTQYRSVIFYNSEKQRAEAEKSKREISESGRYSKPVVTEITKAGVFNKAEEYHQQYLEKRGQATCHPNLS